MTDASVSVPQLSDYAVRVQTFVEVSLDPELVDTFFKPFSIDVLRDRGAGLEAELVGHGSGTIVLSTLATNAGLDLRQLFDEQDADLVAIYDGLRTAGFELPDWEDALFLEEFRIDTRHALPGSTIAAFQQLIRTWQGHAQVAIAFDGSLGMEVADGDAREQLPAGMRHFPDAGVVVWTGDLLN